MTPEDAIIIARSVAKAHGWQWIGPGIASHGSWITRLIYAGGGKVWKVRSHGGKGVKVWVYIKDTNGEVVHKHFEPL